MRQTEINLSINNPLNLPSLPTSHPIHKILGQALKKHSRFERDKNSEAENPSRYWSSSFFTLDKSVFFTELSSESQSKVLANCAHELLEESIYIEQLGMAFGAKMILLSSSIEEQSLYSLIAEEEAQHLYMIFPFAVQNHKRQPNQPFLNFLEQILIGAEMTSLIYLIQVLLEGWGINHYSNMASSCANKSLKSTLEKIVKDEAMHHGTGIIQMQNKLLSEKEKEYVLEMMVILFGMVRSGPQKVVQALEKEKGHFSKSQKIDLFVDLNSQNETMNKINYLKNLVLKHFPSIFAERLNDLKLLTPLNPEKCACI